MAGRSLTLSNVTKFYGSYRAVNDISVDVAEGEFVSFLGPSGSGKTTTLMMIAGFEAPSSGQITLGGRSIESTPPFKRNIGMVFQNYALFPTMTVRANIAFPLRMRRYSHSEITSKVGHAMEMVGLTGFEHRYPKELSGGQQQRVALARALVFQPDLILLDEPLGALDKNLREQMQVELKKMHAQLGITMIYVTHDQVESLTMSDRIVVFNEGRIEQTDRPLELYHKPESAFVASFIGENNLLSGQMRAPGTIDVPGLGQVKVDGLPAPVHSRVWVVVRPERIQLTTNRNKSDDGFAYVVETVLNSGESALVIGKVGQHMVKVRVPDVRSEEIVEGQSYRISWEAKDVHVIPSS
ncbi:MAG: ABC transporter ATP-binding protein [Rhizobiaceae bacterium]